MPWDQPNAPLYLLSRLVPGVAGPRRPDPIGSQAIRRGNLKAGSCRPGRKMGNFGQKWEVAAGGGGLKRRGLALFPPVGGIVARFVAVGIDGVAGEKRLVVVLVVAVVAAHHRRQ